jgi:NAD-dependent deacetylase
MEQQGLLDAVITQNIDMLHRRAGTRELIEMHGSIACCSCPGCGTGVPVEEVRGRLGRAQDGVPRCEVCARALKPDVVLFGEMLSQPALERARELCEAADVLLCVGSSLEVHPVAGLPQITRASGGRVAIITQGPTPLDAIADVRLGGDVVAELQALCAALGLDVS